MGNSSNHKEALQKTEELLQTIQYGSVTLVIQGGKVVGIDKVEKIRLK
ncbi:DUF2292 domain-containing protein [Priestia endophytica]|jgi:hypothetical protein|uniref:DUF2292 domain-containing protein n=1 Tax=Priestia endophytica DSM 13796 TaxID=1121089 RepID=A0A1I6A4X1_9BACI|nr:YezD family protein [Priestia endophytica]KYG28300.1 small protein [Priestia endophytica]MBG9810513.1 small protein [Priestia endophytica]SFQ63682.1 hypothetical protein SAMN02745910_02517 [Priestia endophytica DSM 13796]